MISIHAAISGTDEGLYGYKNGLPWGSLLNELKFFFESVHHMALRARNAGKVPTLVVTNYTWVKCTPNSAKNTLLSLVSNNIIILSRDGYTFDDLKLGINNPEKAFICIGGSELINWVMESGELTHVALSVITPAFGIKLQADTRINATLLFDHILKKNYNNHMFIKYDKYTEKSYSIESALIELA